MRFEEKEKYKEGVRVNCDKKPSEERRWMQYYPEMMLRMIQKPDCTVWEYLERHCPGMDVAAIHYYGEDITWKTVFEESEKCAKSLKAMGFGEGDQIPVFFRLVPNFIYLLLQQKKLEHPCFAEITHFWRM